MNRTGRFAPSPSGPLHVGNLRTALLAWLFARSQGARFFVRVEDLDPGRSRAEHEAGQLADLAAIGLDWDETGNLMRQSERGSRYDEQLAVLERQGLLYPCFCTRAEIREAANAPHGDLPEGAYPGTCRKLTAGQRAARMSGGRPPALRVRAGAEVVAWTDRLHGFQEGVVDDFVVKRNDGGFAYNLAVVVDDADQGIGEVVRGDDLLGTTHRQLWLAGKLGVPAPSHAHVPLVLGPDGARLAKRHGAVTLADRAKRGQTPEDVLAQLARSLRLAGPGEQPTAAELASRFDPERWAPPRSGTLED